MYTFGKKNSYNYNSYHIRYTRIGTICSVLIDI